MTDTSSSTQIPRGSQEFIEALERLKNAPANCKNIFELATDCCKKCPHKAEFNCEECFVQTVGDLDDPYRKEIQERTATGMYSAGIYKGKDGKYHYSHPQGSG